MNITNVIYPYKKNGQWMFDDESKGLHEELFVGGADLIIDILTAYIVGASKGFSLIFSELPYPGHQHRIQWIRHESGGDVYRIDFSDTTHAEGWLCPALLMYFNTAPKDIYLSVSSISEGKENV